MEEQVVIKQNETLANGVRVLRNINIVNTVRNMSPRAKLVLGVYLGGLVTYNLASTYVAGKTALMDCRSDKRTTTPEEEWKAVSRACSRGSFGRFIDSTVWPVTVCGYVMPQLVLSLNSRPTPPLA